MYFFWSFITILHSLLANGDEPDDSTSSVATTSRRSHFFLRCCMSNTSWTRYDVFGCCKENTVVKTFLPKFCI